ncbi:MAG: DUF4410 domain-containing protein [Alphaproteobacteria bacterium]
MLSACSSSVTHRDTVSGQPRTTSERQFTGAISNVSVVLSNDAKEKVKDNAKFDQDELAITVERMLKGQSLLSNTAQSRMEIVVTDMRTRSSFTAIAFGFMAGDDRVEGTVNIYDSQNQLLKSFDVKASYALGGLGGGMDNTRMSWLYEEFAKLTVNELTGKSAE